MFLENNANIDGILSINMKNKYCRLYKINNDMLLQVFVNLNKFQINLDNSWILYENQFMPYVDYSGRQRYTESSLSNYINPSPLNNIEVCMKEIQIDNIIKRILEDNGIKINSFEMLKSGNSVYNSDSYKKYKNMFNKEYVKKFVPNDYSISLSKLFYEYAHTDHPQGLNMGRSLDYKTNLNNNIYITIAKY